VLQHYWWVGVAGVMVALYVTNRWWEQKRREAYESYCLIRGYRFEQERAGAVEHLATDIPLFRAGHSRRWGYTITGRVNGRPFTAGEYRYVTGGGKSSQTHRCAVMLWEAESKVLPRFSLVPEGFLQRLGQRLGTQDIDFAEDEEFSRATQLQGDDEAAVRALFTPERRRFFAGATVAGVPRFDCHVAGAGQRLVWWREARLPAADDLDAFLAEGDAVRRAFLED
jgi:hypothetical protein